MPPPAASGTSTRTGRLGYACPEPVEVACPEPVEVACPEPVEGVWACTVNANNANNNASAFVQVCAFIQ
jgi:hypothetical protein